MNNNIFVINKNPITTDPKSYPFLKTWFNVSLVPDIKNYYVNGHSKYLQKISLSVEKDIKRCKVLWEMFSKNERLYDLWDFRYAFHKAYKFDPHFIVLKTNEEIVGLLPLDYNQKKDVYWWFGGDWQEDNLFFTKNDTYAPLLLFFAPKNLQLYSIKQIPESLSVFGKHVFACDSQYKVDLPKGFTIKDYLQSLKKKKRYNLKRDIKHVGKLNPEIVINNKNDYKIMKKIISRRFHSKGELPDWEEDPEIIEAFDTVINQKSSYDIRYFSVYVNGVCAATDIVAIYKDVYYALKGGYDVEDFSGIGNYIFYKEIEDAIDLGMKEINFLQTDYGWKHKWFKAVSNYRYSTI